ncbi:ArsR/SmtB family transcription factor [Fibrisoma limi]|uniref:ArsR/SmtB family transcription factor n=1 Tax=Fibrisoma limi TaxID=663275 RepID=UPI0005880833|nr:metalloregulator ArsR/SmtB family transcription factor [Fibrisoma limi]
MTEQQRLDKATYLLRAMAHPIRFQITLRLLETNELTVTQLQEQMQLDQSLVSHHLNKMRDRGLLDSRRHGSNRFYSVGDPIYAECISKLLASPLVTNKHA